MIDTRQIVYDIERCINHVPDSCKDCSHYHGTVSIGCMEALMKDTLALIKEQEAVEPTWTCGKPFCGACGLWIPGGKFCSYCGKAVKWE